MAWLLGHRYAGGRNGVEPIEKSQQLNIDLPLQGVLQPKLEAIQEAKKNRNGVVLQTDGSRLNGEKSGAAVVWFDRKPVKWQEKRHFLSKNKDSFDVEIWVISNALLLGIKRTRNISNRTVTVFINS